MLAGLDTIVIDLQDVGVRFYTYTATMGYVMEEAAKRKIAVVVLDRPNPINGWQIEGPASDAAHERVHLVLPGDAGPARDDARRAGAAFQRRAEDWRNADGGASGELAIATYWFDQTGLSWINPSPNMRNLNQATLYPGIGAIEYSNVSVGRGTDQPFEQIGAPWIDGRALAARAQRARAARDPLLSRRVHADRRASTPRQSCQGVFMVITNRTALQPVRLGLEMAAALWKLHGDAIKMENTERLFGSRQALERVKAGEDPARVAAGWSAAEARWRQLRAKYLIYR